MRALLATTAGAGHFGPMVPFAKALREAGHDVAVAAPVSFGEAVARAGFEHLPFADADPEAMGRLFAMLGAMSPDEANATVAREVFGRLDAQAARPGVESIVEAWRPDVIVRDPTEFASFAVAEAHSIPHLRVAIGLLSFEATLFDMLGEPLAELGCATGVGGLRAEAVLSLLPQSFEYGTETGAGAVRRYRDPATAATPEPLPDSWWDGAPDAPLVYVTFGSVAGSIPPFAGVYSHAVPAAAALPIRVLLTTGPGVDVGALGPLPPNVHVERWWPQQHVMAHAAAMVGHGGFGTTLFGLAAGVPQVVVPLFADQPANAQRVAEVGAGVAVHGGVPAIADQLGPALERVLSDPSLRSGAARIAAGIAALPPVADAVPVFETFVAG